jgi:DNA topoisomerase-2
MPLWSLTFERVQKLQKEAEQKQHEIDSLKATTEKKLWTDELNTLKQVRQREREREREREGKRERERERENE